MKRIVKRLLFVVLTMSTLSVSCMSVAEKVEYKPISEREFSVRTVTIHQKHFDRINSTQIWSYDNVKLDPKKNTVWELISADIQTAGIGAHNRKWISHVSGNVYATLTFPMDTVRGQLLPVHQLSAIAVCETIKGIVGENSDIQVKWPNDVIVDGKKISGSIAKVSDMRGDHSICTLGVGINVNLPQDVLDLITEQKATSMYVITGEKYNEKEVLGCYINNFVSVVDAYKAKPEGFLDKFYENMAFKGTLIKVHDDSRHSDKEKPCTKDCYVEGIMEGVSDEGFLKLRTSKEEVEYIYNGTVVKKGL